MCEPGFYGDFCNIPCPSGTYGIRCGGFCSPACYGEECDNVYGCPTKSMSTTRTTFTGSHKKEDIILSAFYIM